MPYNHDKVREDLKIASVFGSHTTGEYIAKLAAHLRDAEEEISALNRTNGDRLLGQQAAERQLSAEVIAHRETKAKLGAEVAELTRQKADLSTALTAISADARSAKKTAADALAKLNPPPATEAPKS